MISDKEYNFDPQGLMSTRDHYESIVRAILTSSIRLSNHSYRRSTKLNSLLKEDVIIVLGITAYEAFTDNNQFTYSYPYPLNNMEHIGILGGKKVYFDNRLKDNQVIFSHSIEEANQYIKTKGRKEKLLKINSTIVE